MFETTSRQKVGWGAWGDTVFAVNPGLKSRDSNPFSGPRLALPSHYELQEIPDLSSAHSGGVEQSWSTSEGEVHVGLALWSPPKQAPNPQRPKKLPRRISPGFYLAPCCRTLQCFEQASSIESKTS